MKKLFKCLFITILTICLLSLYAHFIEPNLLITRNFKISASKNNLKIVLFSDTHFGNNMYPEDKLIDIVTKINNQKADIVIFGGDLIDSYWKSPPDVEYIKRKFSEIKAKYGKFSVYGNHDYGGGAEKVYKEIMDDSGFTILKNETTIIKDIGIRLIGLDDYLLGNPDKYILNDIDTNYYNILISHAPDLIDYLDTSKVNFILAGHTHGGQVTLPFITERVLPVGGQKYIKGLFDLNNSIGTKFYVTSGIGTTQIKLRFLNVPEIINFELIN